MASHISGLLLALKQWQRAINKLGKKGKVSVSREQQLANAQQQVLAYLKSEPVAEAIDELIRQAIAPDGTSPEELRAILVKHSQPLLSIELQTVHPLSVNPEDLEAIVSVFLRSPDEDKPVADSQELGTFFTQLSQAIPREYQATKDLSRKQKKRRRRDLTLGTLHTILGVGLLAGNTQLDMISADVSYIANASYILGGNALLSAMKNLIGEVEDVSAE
ncbi:MAG: hypothetical protein AAFY20_21785 [Cyanobacteria bacterium J06639_14]